MPGGQGSLRRGLGHTCVCASCACMYIHGRVCAENRLSLSPKLSTDSAVQLQNQASHTAASLDTGGFESLGVDLSWEQFFFFFISTHRKSWIFF